MFTLFICSHCLFYFIAFEFHEVDNLDVVSFIDSNPESQKQLYSETALFEEEMDPEKRAVLLGKMERSIPERSTTLLVVKVTATI